MQLPDLCWKEGGLVQCYTEPDVSQPSILMIAGVVLLAFVLLGGIK